MVIPSDCTPATSISYKSRRKRVREWHAWDKINATVLFIVHALCLFAPSTFNWSAFWVAFALYVFTVMFGITLSYHRNLAHRSFKLPKYLEYLFAYIGLHALQGDPIFWVSTHRHHHKFTDTDKDAHSPLEGFWFSHINWIFDYKYMRSKGGRYKNVEDLKSQRYYRFLQKSHWLHLCLLPIILYTFGGFSFVVWGMGVRAVLGSHAIYMVNSVCHVWGHQAWNTGDLSKNNW
ncbi:Acyl-coa c20 delta5-desaturase [Thalictrum thalictroides]|uniref:Acyl-coa c20 delta5-desaturase n=1 Tax=Thalictrum thalictroides TaxID=46969 RepID=A0A7J6WKN9_THATH|nr:Acyl-coa c20 delta5-desaturase [Thalictrum thalictroides]